MVWSSLAASAADPFGDVAWALVRIIAALLGLLLLQILILRWRLSRRRRHIERLHRLWEPILARSAEEVPTRLPRLRGRDTTEFLLIWNYLQESLQYEARQRLNDVARLLGVDRTVFRLVRKGRVRDRLVAITACGHLRAIDVWTDLGRLVCDTDPKVSLSSMKALVRIDARRAPPLIVPRIAERADWSAAVVASVLMEAGPDVISVPLAHAAQAADAPHAPRLIRMLELAHSEVAGPAIRTILERTDDIETLTACLHVARDPGLLGLIRQRTTDERWQVRLQAVLALGRLGLPEDEPLLVRALADPQWWVRYRSAQALANLPFMTAERLDRLSRTVDDRFGRDMLRQVIAERELAC